MEFRHVCVCECVCVCVCAAVCGCVSADDKPTEHLRVFKVSTVVEWNRVGVQTSGESSTTPRAYFVA